MVINCDDAIMNQYENQLDTVSTRPRLITTELTILTDKKVNNSLCVWRTSFSSSDVEPVPIRIANVTYASPLLADSRLVSRGRENPML